MKPQIPNDNDAIEFAESQRDLSFHVREVATLLGISRSRVVQIEQDALEKVARLLRRNGINSIDTFDTNVLLGSRSAPRLKTKDEIQSMDSYSKDRCWISATKIISINEGSISPWDIVRAFAFLRGQRKNEKLPLPPVFDFAGSSFTKVASIIGMNVASDKLQLCLLSSNLANKSMAENFETRLTVLVESEFGLDMHGDFDIPFIKCAILICQ